MISNQAFASASTPIHRLDPRAKVVCAVIWSIAVAGMQDLPVLLTAAVVAIVVLIAARPSPGRLLRHWAAVNMFVAVLWLFVPWSVPGQAIGEWGPITVTREGVLQVVRLTLRFNAIILMCLTLLGTSSLFDFAAGLRALHVPTRLVDLVVFGARYVQLIRRELDRMIAAARCRGFQPNTSAHSYRTHANLVGLLLVRTHDRAERIQEAMLCRGYAGQLPRRPQTELTRTDVLISGLILLATLSLAVAEWTTTR